MASPERTINGDSWRGRAGALAACAALMVFGCGSPPIASRALPGRSVDIAVTPIALDSTDPANRTIGRFVYVGGVEVRSRTTLELSDLRIAGERLAAVSDEGQFFEARLVFDPRGHLAGIVEARAFPLTDQRGESLAAEHGDAEGFDFLGSGDRLVGFEGDHRIWRYPADGGAPRVAVIPNELFASNEGIEAIAVYPPGGANAYLVGSETGRIWLCRLSAACDETPFGDVLPSGFGLTSLASIGDDGLVALLGRAYHPERGTRISLRVVDTRAQPGGVLVDEMILAPPLVVDNFEGIAAVPTADGGVRFYMVSDDNGSDTQHTYLLAFEWRPGGAASP